MSQVQQTVIPMLAYEDGPKAMDWLIEAFGFVEKGRMLAIDGKLLHGELLAGDAQIFLSSAPDHYESPNTLQARYEPARQWMDVPWIINGVLVYVPNLDAHLERARRVGAVILSPIEEGPPGRRYRTADLEGQRWFFFESQRIEGRDQRAQSTLRRF